MVLKLNRNAFEHLIKEDVEWLEKETEDCLERDHIIKILKDCSRFYYKAARVREQDERKT